MYANNEEFITLQKIEKELQADPVLFNICKQIVQQNSNIRLLQFFFEFFKILLSNQYLKDVIQKAIKIFNAFIQKSKQRNKDAQISDLSHYINQKYFDILANYYEKAVIGGIEEANKHINYIYFKKIVKDYIDQPQNQNQQSAKSILTLIEQTYKNFQGTTPSDFEIQLFESLNPEEQELFAQIVNDDQNKVAKKYESLFDKFLLTLSQDFQDRYKAQNCSTVYEFYKCLQKQKVGVEKVLGFIFQEKLNYYVNQQYLNIQTQKAKARKNDLQNILSELEKNVLEQRKDYYSFVEIQYVKYFYKSIKAKKCQQSLQQSFSFRRKLLEFIKQEINAAQTPKQWKPFPQNICQEIYQELYSNLNDINNQEDANLQFKIIQSIQQLMISFFRFRWNYLFLFCVIIVEANFSADELDNMINIAYDMMTSTTRNNLNIPFGKILSMFNEKAKTQITSIYFERQGQNLGYESLLFVESQLKFINNKLIKLILQTSSFQNKAKIYGELKHFELKLMSDCREHLKNYKRVFEQLADSILEGEKEEKEWKAYFYKTITASYFQKWYSIYKEIPNFEKVNMQQFWLYALSIQTLKQDYQNKQLGLYQDIFEREEKICNICIQFIQRDVEKICMQFQQLQPAQQQNLEGYKELMQNFIDIFLKDNPFIIFLPSLLRGIPQNRSKFLNIEKIERIKFLAIAFKDKSQSEVQKLFDCLNLPKDQNNFEWLYKISLQVFNFYLQLNIPPNDPSQFKPLNDPFPNFNSMKTLYDYNTTQYNAICIFTSKFFSLDNKFHIKNEEVMKPDFLKKIYSLMNDKSNFESQNSDQLILQMTQNFMEFKNYKSQLIKEAFQSGDQAFSNKCFELFQKCFFKKSITQEMLDFKKLNKIAFNEVENQLCIQQFLNLVYNQEIKQVDQVNKKKVEDYFKQLIQISPLQVIEKMQKDLVQQQDSYLKELLKRNLQKFKEEQEKYINKPQQQATQAKQSILQTAVVQKKLQQLRNQYKDFQAEDQQVLTFLSDQFSFYMKNLLGKVIQSVLIQKPGYEFKLYQNKGASTIDTQSVKYKQQMEMQRKYGPQKNQYIDQSLLVNTENKLSLTYELCDYTPMQRQVEFRNFLSEIEPHQEDKLKNKIRKNKWKEEHPELEEILKKRIKRGAELWNQVQDFLCKRENNDYMGDSEEESDKVKEQQQQQTDNIDDDQLDMKIQDIQRNSERLLIAGKTHIKTRLNNMESDNPLLTQKVITVKTVQFVLEQHPYFSRSRILYKSYIL